MLSASAKKEVSAQIVVDSSLGWWLCWEGAGTGGHCLLLRGKSSVEKDFGRVWERILKGHVQPLWPLYYYPAEGKGSGKEV